MDTRTAMTPTAQVEAVARALGWRFVEKDALGFAIVNGPLVITNEHARFNLAKQNDLLAFCFAAQGALTYEQRRRYGMILGTAIENHPAYSVRDDDEGIYEFLVAHAPAAVRLTALLTALGGKSDAK